MGAADAGLALAAALSLLGWRPASAAGPDDFIVVQAAPGVFAHLGKHLPLDAPGHDDIANIGFIVGTKCTAVIDTGGSVRIGEALRKQVARRTAVPICYVINTHVHVDHVLGNAAFEGAHPSFVGHAKLAEAIARSRGFFAREYAADLGKAEVIAPDRTVTGALELDLGGRVLTLRAWPTAHTDCDLTVYDGATRTLWTGDLLFRGRLPALDGSLPGWLRALDELERIPARVVVPGHGAITRELKPSIAVERRYLSALSEGVRAAIGRGDSLQQAIAQVAPAERAGWLLWDEVHPRNVVRAYRELEWQ
ncbi:MAG TPA: quinoprotein relay system zinc metallohydrolase 2 [Steroidobacteraceae bacterium]|jgi:quinoprotein relay system zinc metallohydrolase 2|nr:quinoprotein relay system zinc metallohydrolase 2 [Steroidobacteraceae bacterium]